MTKPTADAAPSIPSRGESSTGGGSNYKASSPGTPVAKLVSPEPVKKVTAKGKDQQSTDAP